MITFDNLKIDSKYYRPTEVDSLLGDASKAMQRLNWKPEIGFQELVSEMINSDFEDV